MLYERHSSRFLLLLLLISIPAAAFCSAWQMEDLPTPDQALTAYEKGYQNYRKGLFSASEDCFIEALRL